jgi:hypothetical protein
VEVQWLELVSTLDERRECLVRALAVYLACDEKDRFPALEDYFQDYQDEFFPPVASTGSSTTLALPNGLQQVSSSAATLKADNPNPGSTPLPIKPLILPLNAE